MVHLGTLQQSALQEITILHWSVYVVVKADCALVHQQEAFLLWYELFPSLHSAITPATTKRMLANLKPAYAGKYIRDCINENTPANGMKDLMDYLVYSTYV
jgi:hypothetical protein